MSSPIALTINVREANTVGTLPASLEARLNGTPTKSPEDLAEVLRVHDARTSALRKAHLDAVRDRAARESQRANEAAQRVLRLSVAKADKVRRKMDAATTKTEAKKEAIELERTRRKARREELALAVTEARKAADQMKVNRQAELLENEKTASAKKAKQVHEVQAKGAIAVKHAIAVVQAHKEKEALTAANRGEAIASKLHAAEIRREAGSTSTPPRKVLNRVLNDDKVRCSLLRKLHESSMADKEAKRQAHLASVQGKAHAENAKVEAVVLKVKEPKLEERAAMYEKLLRAEVSRLSALKAKYAHAGKAAKADTVSAIVVRMNLTPRAPPAALVKRLAVSGGALLATAGSRQAGAASRRAAIRGVKLLQLAKGNQKREAATARRAKAHVGLVARACAKSRLSLVTKALADGKVAHTLAEEHRRIAKAAANRAQADGERGAAGKVATSKGVAAVTRRTALLTAIAKPKAFVGRVAASEARRDAAQQARATRGAALATRCAAAAESRQALLLARVELAKKRMAALHPKREVADMEIKTTFSDA